MPRADELHQAVYFGRLSEVKRLLASRVAVNGFATKERESPLQYVSAGHKFRLESYSSILLLLEAGANPLQLHDGNKFYKETYPLFEVINRRHLALARLYLWYIPDDFPYLDVKVNDREGYYHLKPKSDLDAYLSQMEERDIREGKKKGFAACVKEAGKDAQRATRLKIAAKELEARADYAGAGLAYAEVARLYAKHEKLERVLEYYWVGIETHDNARPEEYRPILVAHYRAKRLEFLQKANSCFDKLTLCYPSPESIKAHATVVEDLAVCREKHDAEFFALIERAAQILAKEPHVETLSLAAVNVAFATIASASVSAAGDASTKRASDVTTLEALSDHETEEGADVALLAEAPAAAGAGGSSDFFRAGFFGLRKRAAASSTTAAMHTSVSP